MKTDSAYLKKVKKTVQKSYTIIILFLLLLLGISIGGIKQFTARKTSLYATVKVSQGLWWANTMHPASWMVGSFQKGMTEKSLTGKPLVEVLDVRTYPLGIYTTSEQYDVYLTLKLSPDYNPRTGKYIFKRNPLAVGTPIDLEFPGIEVSGTVIQISEMPIKTEKVQKVVTLKKYMAHQWEYDEIEKEDTFSDGSDTLFEIIDKSTEPSYVAYPGAYPGVGRTLPPFFSAGELPQAITVQARMLLQEQHGILLFKDDLPIQIGRTINLQTSRYFFEEYTVTAITDEAP